MAKPTFDTSDVKENRIKGGIGYLFILFFMPFILCPNSKYGRYCANQGLIGLITYAIVSLAFAILHGVLGWIPLVGWLIWLAGVIAKWAVGLVIVYYAYLACLKGDARELPVVGSFTIFK